MMKTPSVVTIELELVYPSFGPFTAPGSHSPDLSHTQTYFNAQNFTVTILRYRQLVETAHFAMPPSHKTWYVFRAGEGLQYLCTISWIQSLPWQCHTAAWSEIRKYAAAQVDTVFKTTPGYLLRARLWSNICTGHYEHLPHFLHQSRSYEMFSEHLNI